MDRNVRKRLSRFVAAVSPLPFLLSGAPAYAGDLLAGVMEIISGALGFAGGIIMGVGLIMLAVQLRMDTAGGAQLMGAIGMIILGVLMMAMRGLATV